MFSVSLYAAEEGQMKVRGQGCGVNHTSILLLSRTSPLGLSPWDGSLAPKLPFFASCIKTFWSHVPFF